MVRRIGVLNPSFSCFRCFRLMDVELEVDPRRSEEEQIKIAVMALLDEDKDDLVQWVIEVSDSSLFQCESTNRTWPNADGSLTIVYYCFFNLDIFL